MIVAWLLALAFVAGDDPLHLPTTVIVLDQGGTAVLDGANGRLAFFDATGKLTGFAGQRGKGKGEFLDPLGMCTGPNGTILVADTGNARIQVLDAEGRCLREVKVEGRPTGVACDPEGEMLFVTDRRNHAVQVLSFLDGTLLASHALEAGLFPAYPCSPLFHQGCLFVVEPLNGRIVCLNSDGVRERYIGGFGVGEGSLYSPKAVAVDGEGRLFVSDSFLGKVAVYSREGKYLGGIDGFDTPFGLAFDKRGRLSVVEMGTGKLLIRESDYRPPHTGEDEGQEILRCNACHPPEDDMETAGRPAMCLKCHDGSIVDSRRRAFAAHSHRDVSLGEDTCMTCHQAHGGDDFYDMDTAIYLRYPGLEGAACRTCHSEPLKAMGPGHPLGMMEKPLSQSLISKGAAASSSLDCRTCHLPHGRGDRYLLLAPGEALCMECHDKANHERVLHFDGSLFNCLDCHRVHGGLKGKPGDRACGECHETQAAVRETVHQAEGCTDCHSAFDASARCSACHEQMSRTHHHGEKLPAGDRFEQVGCATCHDPHIKAREFLIPGTASKLCAACHGPKGLWLYLRSHSQGGVSR